MMCTSCRMPGTVSRVPSKLMPGVTFYLCRLCADKALEPRFAIVLTAHLVGIDAVAKYIKERRYLGDEIVASELIV